MASSPILILDEPTAALDSESEKLVMDALEKLMKGRTVIVIAHRLSTIREADKILVMKDGALVEQGNHDQLMALGGLYTELYKTQFAEEPPAVNLSANPERKSVTAAEGECRTH